MYFRFCILIKINRKIVKKSNEKINSYPFIDIVNEQ